MSMYPSRETTHVHKFCQNIFALCIVNVKTFLASWDECPGSKYHSTGVCVGCVNKNFNIGHNSNTTRDKAFIFHICDPSGEKGPSGGQLSKSIFSHKLVNKLLNDTFISFISS